MKRFFAITALSISFCLFHFAFACLAQAAPSLTASNVSAAAGSTANIDITFNTTPGDNVSLITFDILLPPGVSTNTITNGPVITNAGKSTQNGVNNGNHWTLVVSGGNSVMSGGLLLTAQVQIAAGTPAGALPITLTTPSDGFSDPNGNAVAAAPHTPGTLTVTVPNNPPTVATPASAAPSPVTGTTTNLSVLGADDGGAANLTYTWATTGTPPAVSTFSVNGTNAARNTTATFSRAGAYSFQVTIRDAQGLTVTSNVNVTVNQTLTSINVTPPTANVTVNSTFTFSAAGLDQFGQAMTTPPTFTWSVTGGGTIANTGVFTAGAAAGGPFMVTATSGGKSGTAQVTVTNLAPTVVTPASATPNPVTGTTTNLSVLGADDGGAANLTYTWATTGTPPAVSPFSVNGTNTARNTTATFTRAGAYSFQVTIRDAQGLTVTSSVNVTVNQTLTTINVTPTTTTVTVNNTFPFSSAGIDQFGQAMTAPPTFTWTVTGGGTIANTGVFTAGATPGGPFTVTAASGGRTGTAQVTVVAAPNNPPTVVTPASATPNPVTGTTTNLSVLGADDGGAANLTYTWATTGTPPAVSTFSVNGTNAARNTAATFSRAGTYNFQVTIRDAQNLSVTSNVTVVVNQTLTTINVTPPTATVTVNSTFTFSAAGLDQFNQAMATPPTFTWTVPSAAGSINTSGLFTAGVAPGGPFDVTAASGGRTGTALVTVVAAPQLPFFFSEPQNASVLVGSNATFTVFAVGNPAPTLQWQRRATGAPGFTNMTGETNQTLVVSNAQLTDNGSQYRCVATNSAGSATSAAATLTVIAGGTAPTISQHPQSQTVNAGQIVSFSVIATGTQPLSYLWQIAAPGSSTFVDFPFATTDTYTFTALAQNNGAQYRCVVTNVVGSTTSLAATLTVNSVPLVVDAGPDQTITLPSTATLVGTTSATMPISQQWIQDSGPGIATITPLSLTSAMVSFPQAGVYVMRFSVLDADFTSGSDTVQITVNPQSPPALPPTITSQPQNVSVLAGLNASFNVTATGNQPLAYQWQSRPSASGTFTDISGATSSTHNLTNVLLTQSGSQYRCVVSNSTGTATSSAATLTVTSSVTAPTVTGQPQDLTVIAGQNASFNVTATGSLPLTYQWQLRPSAVGTFTNIAGANSATYTMTNAQVSQSGSQFRCVVSNSAAPGGVNSNAATLTVNAAPVAPTITGHPQSIGVLAGQNAIFNVSASGDLPLTYRWQSRPSAAGTFSDMAGATTATLTFTNAQVTDSGSQYRCIVTNSTGTATSNTATLTVNPAPLLPPTLNLPNPAYLPVNGSLSVNDSNGANVSFEWSFNLISNNTPGAGAGVIGHATSVTNFPVQGRVASLGAMGLVPGYYEVRVHTVRSGVPNSADAQGFVTLVSADFSAVRVFPQPWRSDRHSMPLITFDGLPLGSSVKIFTISGRLVKKLPFFAATEARWDLMNDSGDRVASGIYMYLISVDGSKDKASGKLVIIR